MSALRKELAFPAAMLSRLRNDQTPSELWVNMLRSQTYSLRVPTVTVWFPIGRKVRFSVTSQLLVSSWLPCEN